MDFAHAHLDSESDVDIPSYFKQTDGNVRCLISTVEFGMGMQVENVTYVLHWGSPKSIIDYFQEIGRCARNGLEGEALMYFPPNTIRKDRIGSDMHQVINIAKSSCIRFAALKSLKLRLCTDIDT